MRKGSSKGYLILAAVFFVIALLWFLWIKSAAVGVIWALCAIAELIISLIVRRREKSDK